jgi:tRNA threonylcarbamoyl adenosine modification protein YeaZ
LDYRANCLLAIDTSTAHCAAAIFLNGKVFTSVKEMKKGQAELLFEVIEDALKKAKIEKTRIDLIVVGIGPGNFTGIRIGLAAAKGLSLSLKVPISGVNSFQASLYGQNDYEIAAIPARQNLYYLGTINGDFKTNLTKDGTETKRFANRPKGKEFIKNMAIFGADLKFSLSKPAPLYMKPANAQPHTEKISIIK